MGGDTSPEQQYSLRWNDFHSSILSSFRHLRDEEDFVDVTLACDGCSFTAHKVVLSACSPYFRRLLKANPCQHPIVILRDVQQKDMESLLRFMYNGEVHIGQEHLTDFLKTAQMLQVRGLADVSAGSAAGQRLTSASEQKISPNSTSLPWPTDRPEVPRNDILTSPPAKRARSSERCSYSPEPVRPNSPTIRQEGNSEAMQDSLLGQALEGGPTIISKTEKGNSDSSVLAQSTGEDSNSSDTAMSDAGHGDEPVTPKTEPSDYPMLDDHHPFNTNGSIMDPSRTPGGFHNALLGLQGLGGLMPGPSGMHNSPDNFDATGGGTGKVVPRPRTCRSNLPSHHIRRVVYPSQHNNRTSTTIATPAATASNKQQVNVKYECPLCDLSLPSISTLRNHIDEHYPRDSPICPVISCGKVFSHPNSVRNHMRLKHSYQWEIMKQVKWTM